MFDPAIWPLGCPPDNAAPPSGTYFRLATSSPPREDDFKTNEEEGTKLNARPCKRRALSLCLTLNDARKLMALYPPLGSFVAEVRLAPAHGVVLVTGQQGHVAYWPCDNVAPGNRLGLVTAVH